MPIYPVKVKERRIEDGVEIEEEVKVNVDDAEVEDFMSGEDNSTPTEFLVRSEESLPLPWMQPSNEEDPDDIFEYPPSDAEGVELTTLDPDNWDNDPPRTIAEAIDRIAARIVGGGIGPIA